MKATLLLIDADGNKARVDPGSAAEADFRERGYKAEGEAVEPEGEPVAEGEGEGETAENAEHVSKRGRPRTRF